MFRKGITGMLLCILVCGLLLCGCGVRKAEKEKVRDLEYTVVEDEDLPEELKEQIDLKKESHFKFTYETGEYLYIVMGYGQQETGGYNIQVKELSGPEKGKTISQSPSCPYIVVKTELMKEPVVFE